MIEVQTLKLFLEGLIVLIKVFRSPGEKKKKEMFVSQFRRLIENEESLDSFINGNNVSPSSLYTSGVSEVREKK